jgi:carbamate kinase
MEGKLIVIAIGGNSLIEDSRHVTVHSQYDAANKTAKHIARLVKAGNRVVIAHGNGPQVGYILRRAEIASTELHTVPLDSCVADTQGAIGYQLQMALDNQMAADGLKKNIATVVTQVEVKDDDPSFRKPTKPIGSFMSEEVAMEHKTKDNWSVVEDAGRGWRRVVASPKPVSIIELETIKCLLDNGIIVIAAGGGGIPVVKAADGTLTGREAVIDKDLAAAMLAKDLKADMFVISTAVPKVCLNFGKPNQKTLDSMSVKEAEEYMSEGHFAPGSMLPKIQALTDYVKSTGNMGIVTDPENLYDAVYGDMGTKVVKG